MKELDDTKPIADDELLYRRIPVSTNWYNATAGLSPLAFRPNDNDATGVSVFRGPPYNTPEAASRGRPNKSYFVAVLRVGDLRGYGNYGGDRPDGGNERARRDHEPYRRESPDR